MGKAIVVVVETHISLNPHVDTSQATSFLSYPCTNSHVIFSSHPDGDSGMWLLDSGATDHFTFDVADFSYISPQRRKSIANENGIVSLIIGASTVTLSQNLRLYNTLLVHLLSVSQITADYWNISYLA